MSVTQVDWSGWSCIFTVQYSHLIISFLPLSLVRLLSEEKCEARWLWAMRLLMSGCVECHCWVLTSDLHFLDNNVTVLLIDMFSYNVQYFDWHITTKFQTGFVLCSTVIGSGCRDRSAICSVPCQPLRHCAGRVIKHWQNECLSDDDFVTCVA